ncbi:MAG: hypothetical protein K940chlam1_00661 [Candidatus Anoxychlamydiales bacterium]|nr:hypothetical protein [Candidatus Anoxychlamydiales bacterium]NGX36068.1 hypothetical protein [Candidatus Anoxychlamydiales bacterium]
MSKLDIFIWFNTIVAIMGTILNAKQVRFGFIVWMITNAVFVVFNIYMKIYPMAALFSVYFGLALYGWISWGKKSSKAETQTT